MFSDFRFKKKHKHKHSKKQHIVKQMQASQLGIIKAPGSPSQFSDDIGKILYLMTLSVKSFKIF